MLKQLTLWIGKAILENIGMISALLGAGVLKVYVDRGQVLTFWQRVLKFSVAIICGAITSWVLIKSGQERTAIFAGPVATILGESFVKWLTINSPRLYELLLAFVTKNKDKAPTNDQ